MTGLYSLWVVFIFQVGVSCVKLLAVLQPLFHLHVTQFLQPPTQPPLKVPPKPSGPRGRKLPSRSYDYQALPQQDFLVNLPLFD